MSTQRLFWMASRSVQKKAEDVIIIRCGADNLAYALVGGGQGGCILIDPGCADAVLKTLAQYGLRPELMLATHGHADHTAGAAVITSQTGCPLRQPGSGGIPREIEWSGGMLSVWPVPGHTRDHVAYLDSGRNLLFTGDTLFVAGCGRISGCDAETMWQSLERLATLPESLRIFPGHDYTADNLAFAADLVPEDKAVAERLAYARAGDALVPSTIGEERNTNPFLRCADPDFRARIGLAHLTALECFKQLRRRKDNW